MASRPDWGQNAGADRLLLELAEGSDILVRSRHILKDETDLPAQEQNLVFDNETDAVNGVGVAFLLILCPFCPLHFLLTLG